jgi:DNA replication protein DnaC
LLPNDNLIEDYQNLCRKVNFPSRYTGELVGEKWLAALDKVKAVVEAGGIATLYGNRGSGKTRMALRIAEIARLPKCELPKDGSRTRYRDCIYATAMELFLDLRSANHPKSEETPKQVMNRYEGAALLVIDEIQVRGETRFEDDTLTHVIDRRYRHGRPTIIIGNVDKEHLAKQLSASVLDRIREKGCGVRFDWESYRKPNTEKSQGQLL